MESQSSKNKFLISHILNQLVEACGLIDVWNKKILTADDYLSSPAGMQVMAASCMMIENIGEGIKKIDKLSPGFLSSNCPQIQWKNIKGLRDHIAHGYFNLDEEIIFDVSKNEIPILSEALDKLKKLM